jgi:hypothetical protein
MKINKIPEIEIATRRTVSMYTAYRGHLVSVKVSNTNLCHFYV